MVPIIAFSLAAFLSIEGMQAWLGGRYGTAAASFFFGGMFATAVVYPLWEFGPIAQIIVSTIVLAYVAMTTWAGFRWAFFS